MLDLLLTIIIDHYMVLKDAVEGVRRPALRVDGGVQVEPGLVLLEAVLHKVGNLGQNVQV